MNNKVINLSDRTSDLLYTINQDIKEKYIPYEVQNQERSWVNTYNDIKGESWPECKSYDDFNFLPEHIQNECIHVHNFSPDILKKAIIADADVKFGKKNQIVLSSWISDFLEQHLEVLQDKKVIDLACNFGHWSVFSYLNQCRSLVGADIRDDNLKVAKSIQQDMCLSDDQISFVKADIHDYKHMTELCAEKDTVLLLGIMYHIHDHYNVLESVCQPTVQSVVIETGEANEIIHSNDPLVWWKYEPTFELIAGAVNNTAEVLVGYPNVVWFDMVMKKLGFERVASSRHDIHSSTQKIEKLKQTRSVFLYNRLK